MDKKHVLKGELHFEGNWNMLDKALARTLYPVYRNMYVGLTNPLLETLNDLWDQIKDQDQRSYDEYIAEALNMHTATITWMIRQKIKDPIVIGYFDIEKGCDFILINKNGGKCFMTIVEE